MMKRHHLPQSSCCFAAGYEISESRVVSVLFSAWFTADRAVGVGGFAAGSVARSRLSPGSKRNGKNAARVRTTRGVLVGEDDGSLEP